MLNFFTLFFLFIVSIGQLIGAPNPNDPKYNWMNELVEKDFKFFQNGIYLETLNKSQNQGIRMSRAKVIDNRLYITKKSYNWEKPNGEREYTEDRPLKGMLTYLIEKYGLPDLDILYLDDDGMHFSEEGGAPIFCSSKKKSVGQALHFVDVLHIMPHPVWDDMVNRINQLNHGLPWEKRIDKLVWRGSPTDIFVSGCKYAHEWRKSPRGAVCALTAQYPHLIDAWYVNDLLDASGKPMGLLPIGSFLTLEQQLNYKYQIILDGWATTFPGDRWRLLSGSVVFKPESDFTAWFYDAIIPWIHYVPLKKDLSDLIEKLEYLQQHPEIAKQLAINAREFALNNLKSEDIAIYCYKALLKYATLQKFKPSL